MAVQPYLAMTAAEFFAIRKLPTPICWMACHFSPWGTGLSNLPAELPPGSILMINDQLPFSDHDPERILAQLQPIAKTPGCAGVLLDFQRPNIPQLQELGAFLSSALPCPTAVTEWYAEGLACPVFLSPCPHHTHLSEHIAPWNGREVWLDVAVDAETITLTKDGASILPLPLGEIPSGGHWDEALHCHYSIQNGADFAQFTLWRTREDLNALAEEAGQLGIETMVGLYQEWQRW